MLYQLSYVGIVPKVQVSLSYEVQLRFLYGVLYAAVDSFLQSTAWEAHSPVLSL